MGFFIRIYVEVGHLPQKKRTSSKKRKRKTNQKTTNNENIIREEFPITSDPLIPEQYDDNISFYERENVDLLDTIDGVEWDRNQFRQDFPHLADELQDDDRVYPIDAVRWEDEAPIDDEIGTPEEPNLNSLLHRCKTEEEAIEIIQYFEKQGELSFQEASKLISKIESKGLNAFQRKKRKN